MLKGCGWFVAQLLHINFSLGALLILSNDLQGSIVIDKNSGQVMNYQDFGGGITALFTALLITVVLWTVIRTVWGSANLEKAVLVHFVIVFAFKGALIWSIYFSGKIDPRILARYSLYPGLFVPDAIALILAVALILFNQPSAGEESETEIK
ncbi:MAG TPA: hypothetical protein DCG57_08455 [Candidatus Riflebacteria bacterium]|jgi:hypothetical protein|nr:hypothetical protein [Candidatus Riflebacteria bacterium]